MLVELGFSLCEGIQINTGYTTRATDGGINIRYKRHVLNISYKRHVLKRIKKYRLPEDETLAYHNLKGRA